MSSFSCVFGGEEEEEKKKREKKKKKTQEEMTRHTGTPNKYVRKSKSFK